VSVARLPPIHQQPLRADVVAFLEGAALPTSDLTEKHMQDFFHVGPASAPIGIVGVQLYGADALLRSLLVSAAHRTQGVGGRLVEHAEQHACQRGASTVYLLTTTAESFFRSCGYTVTPRDDAPFAIRSTPEFSNLCPASAAFLSKRL
jgi:amino-acid N-acetyltransferase